MFFKRQVLVKPVPGFNLVPSGMVTSDPKEAWSQVCTVAVGGTAVGCGVCVAVGGAWVVGEAATAVAGWVRLALTVSAIWVSRISALAGVRVTGVGLLPVVGRLQAMTAK